MRHLANTPATLTLPQTWFDLVRPGGGVYGLSPLPAAGRRLAPARDDGRAPALTRSSGCRGDPVSYGHRYITPAGSTWGWSRWATPTASRGMRRAGARCWSAVCGGRVAGRVAMDQFVVDLVGDELEPGAGDVLFGPGDRGEPTAEDWAVAADTIAYEIVTRIGPRVDRVYVNEEPADPGTDPDEQ